MGKYFNYLIEQFKQANGIKNVDINSESFMKEFSEWIKARQLFGKKYSLFIDSMETHPQIDSEISLETSKGQYDSVSSSLDLGVITPYSDGMEKVTSGTIIVGEFKIYDGMPTILTHNKDDNQIAKVDTTIVRRFLTQNPYTMGHIQNWEQIHNSDEANITVGIFGSIYDKDIEEKIKQLKSLRDKLYGSFKEDYTTLDDSYYYAISSDRIVKKLVKTRIMGR